MIKHWVATLVGQTKVQNCIIFMHTPSLTKLAPPKLQREWKHMKNCVETRINSINFTEKENRENQSMLCFKFTKKVINN